LQWRADQLDAAETDIVAAAAAGDMAAFDSAVDAFRLACSDPALETPDQDGWSTSWIQDRIASIESRIPDLARQCGFTV
jgi:hypothetical protein